MIEWDPWMDACECSMFDPSCEPCSRTFTQRSYASGALSVWSLGKALEQIAQMVLWEMLSPSWRRSTSVDVYWTIR